jgi:hypothetical protein
MTDHFDFPQCSETFANTPLQKNQGMFAIREKRGISSASIRAS